MADYSQKAKAAWVDSIFIRPLIEIQPQNSEMIITDCHNQKKTG